ncbi:MAG: nitrous oxide-stimulated promoter family protein [Erysipelotrichales bacterium]|nr:nitrous oxide-stimulated promoter family protein [Erysipelotrichales bacterium]
MKIEKERRIVGEMIALYYKNNYHQTIDDNEEAKELINYVNHRLSVCPFKDKKKFCSHCSVHCYEESKRELIKKVMRYSGPRLLFTHPLLVIKHVIEK